MPNGSLLGRRAGFWRRIGAFLCDAIIITVPLLFVFAGIYAISHGTVQGSAIFSRCQDARQMSQLLEGLNPPPPAGSNFAQLCVGSNFGLEAGRWLVVGRVTKEGIVTKTISRSYGVDAESRITKVTRLDGLPFLVLFVYLVTLEWRFGATLGKRLLRIRVFDAAHPVPMLVVILVHLIVYRDDLEALFSTNFFIWFAAAGILGQVWNLWVFVDIVRKRDPIYDKIAGTAALRAADLDRGSTPGGA